MHKILYLKPTNVELDFTTPTLLYFGAQIASCAGFGKVTIDESPETVPTRIRKFCGTITLFGAVRLRPDGPG